MERNGDYKVKLSDLIPWNISAYYNRNSEALLRGEHRAVRRASMLFGTHFSYYALPALTAVNYFAEPIGEIIGTYL